MSAARELPGPSDAHEGFFARQIRVNFRILVRMIGFERARETVAYIIIAEAERKSNG